MSRKSLERAKFCFSPDPKAVVVVIGGKDSGKSTTVRFLLNLLLSSFDSVGLLDCDVGQAEMTPGEFLALTKLEKPLFGESNELLFRRRLYFLRRIESSVSFPSSLTITEICDTVGSVNVLM